MNSNKQTVLHPQAEQQGQLMCSKMKKVLALTLLLAFLPLTASAASELTSVGYSSQADDQVNITLSTSGDRPVASVFATESPARVVLDLADTDSTVSTDPVSVGVGVVQRYSTISAGGRTRVIVDLARPSSYDYETTDSGVVLSIGGGSTGAVAAASTASSRPVSNNSYTVENVDFRRGSNGQSRVIVSLNRPGASVSVNERADRLHVDIFNTTLPDALNQRLDVADFATPVQMIDAHPQGNGVRLDLAVTGAYEHLAFQSENDFIIEVSEPERVAASQAQEEVKFFEDRTYDGSRVTFNFQDIPVRTVLQVIADVADLNIVVADNVEGNLTLRLTNVPWDQALDIVLDARNLDKRENGNVIWIAPTGDIAQREQELLQAIQEKQELEPLQTALISINYATAADLKALIDESFESGGEEGLLSERGSVSIDERTNTLLVTDTPDRIVEIRRLVAELDYPVRQVQIESRIVIASNDFGHELGVRFGVTHSHQGSNLFGISGNGDAPTIANPGVTVDGEENDGADTFPNNRTSRYNVNLPAPSSNAGTFGLSFISGSYLLDLELSALETEGRGEVVSTPRVITANQAEAFIQQGVEIPYEEATSSGATSVQFKEAVLELRATPLITPDNRIQLDLQVKQDTVGEIFQTARGGTVPSIDTRELNTKVLVNNGETVVLGGIFQDERNSSEDKVPFLGDIPAIGNLFKRRTSENKKRELLIFVTPSIVEERPIVN